MSNASLTSDSKTLEESPTTTHRLRSALHSLSATVRSAGAALGFWTAVVTPFLYLPLLSELTTTQDLLAFLCLLLINVIGLFAGRNHNKAATGARDE
jgi:hypothetical protein